MEKSLKEILNDELQIKNLTLGKIREQTGIAERYLSAFFDGKKEKLPAAPYMRGYLLKIASALDLNGKDLWEKYKDTLEPKSSGSSDRLPENRFATKKISKKWIAIGLAIILALIYLSINLNQLLGRPDLEITNPLAETLVTGNSFITLEGKINPNDTLLIDGEEITVSPDGVFRKDYLLQPGLNKIQFSVKKLLGKEITVTRQIIYQSQ